ncbi:MAG: polyprenyl synthetase family protein [Bacteroidales bacterium]|nr:polyprenyl synthetase family protein [Bacteroidales bacterium]
MILLFGMMTSLKEITKPIESDIKEFNCLFAEKMRSESLFLDKILKYVLKTKGKQIRPILVLLSGGMFGKINTSTHTAATLIEMLHTATLIHDDVVDEADMRRGFFSINALWKNKAAVLVGDYLLSKGLLTALHGKEYEILHIVSDAVNNMSEGELIQIKKARTMNIDEETYFTIVRKKTASLIAACCSAGTYTTTGDKAITEKMKQFGEYLGIAFQIKDDLLDFDANNKTGKSAQNDIKNKKISLPLIHTIKNVNIVERKHILGLLKNQNSPKKKMSELIEFIRQQKGFEYTETRMNEYKNLALEILSGFPDSAYKKSLENLVIFTTERVY